MRMKGMGRYKVLGLRFKAIISIELKWSIGKKEREESFIEHLRKNEMSAAQWQIATLVKMSFAAENVKTMVFSIPNRPPFQSGQHYDIRLTAPSGYVAERSYSIASPPEEENLEFGIELLENGEVSPYLWNMTVGRQIEMRGPIGGHFVWNTSFKEPLILIGGGSGMVPLVSMLRHHMHHLESETFREVRILLSAKTLERILYKDELAASTKRDPHLKIFTTLTGKKSDGWNGYSRRVDQTMLAEVFGDLKKKDSLTFI